MAAVTPLTTRQRLIYLLWRNGVTRKEIAYRRGLTEAAVNGLLDEALRKVRAMGVRGVVRQ